MHCAQTCGARWRHPQHCTMLVIMPSGGTMVACAPCAPMVSGVFLFARRAAEIINPKTIQTLDFRLEEIESIMGSRTVIESPATTNTRILSHALSNIGLAVSLLNMADVEAPAYFQISPQNHSPWVAVTSIIFLIHSILAVIAKIVSRLHMTGMKTCDWLIVVSTLAAFGETILVIAACKDGLGQHEALIISSQLRRYYQVSYISTPAYKTQLRLPSRTSTQLLCCSSYPMLSRKLQFVSTCWQSPLNERFSWHATHCLPSPLPGPLALSSP